MTEMLTTAPATRFTSGAKLGRRTSGIEAGASGMDIATSRPIAGTARSATLPDTEHRGKDWPLKAAAANRICHDHAPSITGKP